MTLEFSHSGFCDICESSVVFEAKYDWFRDHLLCSGCGSLPRERALMTVLKQYFPKWRSAKIHESSPGDRGVSRRLSLECRKYIRSYYFPDAPQGDTHPEFNARCENLEALTFADASFDLFITQDVLEHVLDPASALREIGRVLKPGGAHVFTVPLVNKHQPTSARARWTENGDIQHLKDQQYHGCPVDQRGALVTTDWGFDIAGIIYEVCGMPTHMVTINDIDRGIRAEYIEVLISFKR